MSRRSFLIKEEGDRILTNLASSCNYTTETTTPVAQYLLLNHRKFFAHGSLREIKVKNLGCGVKEVRSIEAPYETP